MVLTPRGRLALADTALVRDRFAKGTIDDIALVVTYGGRTPEWPA